MKKLLAIAVSAAFAVSSFGALAQDKKKDEVKAKQGGGVTAADKKSAVTTATDKPKKATGDGPAPKNIGKRKDEKERMEKK